MLNLSGSPSVPSVPSVVKTLLLFAFFAHFAHFVVKSGPPFWTSFGMSKTQFIACRSATCSNAICNFLDIPPLSGGSVVKPLPPKTEKHES
jgi:hypothetical protein